MVFQPWRRWAAYLMVLILSSCSFFLALWWGSRRSSDIGEGRYSLLPVHMACRSLERVRWLGHTDFPTFLISSCFMSLEDVGFARKFVIVVYRKFFESTRSVECQRITDRFRPSCFDHQWRSEAGNKCCSWHSLRPQLRHSTSPVSLFFRNILRPFWSSPSPSELRRVFH